jgi:hypothetical protein
MSLLLASLAFPATPADVAEVKVYVDGTKSCQGHKPLSIIGDNMYVFVLEDAEALVNGVWTNELRVSFSVPVCSFGGGMTKPPTGWPYSGTVEDLGWDGKVEAGTIPVTANTVSTIDFSDDGTDHTIGESNRAMWQSIYDRAIATVVTQCRNSP